MSIRADGRTAVHSAGVMVTGGATVRDGGITVTGGITIYSGGLNLPSMGITGGIQQFSSSPPLFHVCLF